MYFSRGYMMIEMTTGKLPWSNLNVEKELDEIGEMKSNYWKEPYLSKMLHDCPKEYKEILE